MIVFLVDVSQGERMSAVKGEPHDRALEFAVPLCPCALCAVADRCGATRVAVHCARSISTGSGDC